MTMLFSIVIPVYNVEGYIEKCLDSILHQSFTDYEVILVDDGSTDRSPEICDSYAKKDDRIKVFHKNNEGSNSARNMGILAAKGEYICLVDSDDRVSEDWLETVHHSIQAAPQRPDIILYGYKHVFCDREEDIVYDMDEGYYDREKLERQVFPRLINKDPNYYFESLFSQAPWNKVYKKELLQAHVCNNTSIKVANDCAFTYECVLYANSMYVCRDILYYYIAYSQNSLQRTYHPDIYNNYAALFAYLEERIKDLHPTIPMQLNAFYFFHVRKSVIQDMVHYNSIRKAAANVKKGIEESSILEFIHTEWLPVKKRIFINILKMRLYKTALFLMKLKEKMM